MNIQDTINKIWDDLWDRTFFYSQDALEQLANEAEKEYERLGMSKMW